jgi:hypothetical protein
MTMGEWEKAHAVEILVGIQREIALTHDLIADIKDLMTSIEERLDVISKAARKAREGHAGVKREGPLG